MIKKTPFLLPVQCNQNQQGSVPPQDAAFSAKALHRPLAKYGQCVSRHEAVPKTKYHSDTSFYYLSCFKSLKEMAKQNHHNSSYETYSLCVLQFTYFAKIK